MNSLYVYNIYAINGVSNLKKSFTVHGRFYTALFVTLQDENESYSLLMNYFYKYLTPSEIWSPFRVTTHFTEPLLPLRTKSKSSYHITNCKISDTSKISPWAISLT